MKEFGSMEDFDALERNARKRNQISDGFGSEPQQ
jgi:hypothetical protein